MIAYVQLFGEFIVSQRGEIFYKSSNCLVYIEDVAMTLYNISLLQAAIDRKAEAKETAQKALAIYKELAKAYPQIWNRDVEKTERWLKDLS